MFASSSRSLIAGLLGFTLLTSACAATVDDSGAMLPVGECSADAPGCDDTPMGDEAMDCAAGGPCNDAGQPAVEAEMRLMAPDINIIDEVAEGTVMVSATPGVVAEPTAIFVRWAKVNGAVLTLVFEYSGVCTAIERVDVSETASEVTVTLLGGEDTTATCEDTEASMQIEVQLNAELGTRALLDGSRVAPVGANV